MGLTFGIIIGVALLLYLIWRRAQRKQAAKDAERREHEPAFGEAETDVDAFEDRRHAAAGACAHSPTIRAIAHMAQIFETFLISRSVVKIQARGRGMITRNVDRKELAAASIVTKDEVCRMCV